MNEIKTSVKTAALGRVSVDVLAIPVFKTKRPVEEFAKDLDRKMKGKLSNVEKFEGFHGESGSQISLFSHGLLGCRQVTLFGLGESAKWKMDFLRRAAGQIARQCLHSKGKKLAFALPSLELSQYRYSASPQEIAQTLVEGALLGCYRFSKYQKPKKNSSTLEEIQIICPDKHLEKSVLEGVKRAHVFATATAAARDLVNEPPSMLTPRHLAEQTRKLLSKRNIKLTLLSVKQIEKLGMNAFLAVSRGSPEAPTLIKMEYIPKKPATKHLVLIGKGVTFDSGGLSLKPAKSMETMKDDMAGAAAVIATFYGLSHLKPRVKVTGFVLATENMPDGRAMKPGDVVKAFNGKTIEILNTDAEGRLTLADALSYAETLNPDQIIDLATLTGACLVALGTSISAILSNSPELTQGLQEAGKQTGETFWELPLYEDYRELIKSDIADIKNTGSSYGGTITASLFLSEFIKKCPWAHLDIAGPAWSEREAGHLSKGGTGFGVRTLLNYISSL